MDKTTYKAKTYYQQTDVVQRYDAERFSSWHGKLVHQAESRALEHAIDRYFTPGGTVIDLPCGTGRLLDVYAQRDFQVTGVDISDEMLTVAGARFKDNPRFSFQKGDAEALPFADGSFGYLSSFRLMAHLPPPVRQRVLAEMIRVTRLVLVINLHFDVISPLMLFNKAFRRHALPVNPVQERAFRNEIRNMSGVELCEIRKLSLYERSSAIVVLRKQAP